MWLNEKEEDTYGPFSKYIDEHENETFRFIYADGAELLVKFETEYESDNGLALHEEDYEEYWETAFKIIDVIKDDKNIFEIGKYVLVNYHTVPQKYEVI